jgi:hypothetical protein
MLADDMGDCAVCGQRAVRLFVSKVTGRVLSYRESQYTEHLCMTHGKQLYDQVTAHTLKKGWLSPLGVLRVLYTLDENSLNYILFKRAFSVERNDR